MKFLANLQTPLEPQSKKEQESCNCSGQCHILCIQGFFFQKYREEKKIERWQAVLISEVCWEKNFSCFSLPQSLDVLHPCLEVAGDDCLSKLYNLTHLKYFSRAFMEQLLYTYICNLIRGFQQLPIPLGLIKTSAVSTPVSISLNLANESAK